jgi:hypothetical protein
MPIFRSKSLQTVVSNGGMRGSLFVDPTLRRRAA